MYELTNSKLKTKSNLKILDNAALFAETVSIGSHLNPSSPQIAATEDGNVYVVWVDKNSTSGNKALYFKKISQYFFERLN